MASVYRKQNRWWIHFKDGTGRWRDISTTVDTKSSAKAIARELDHKAERQRLGLEAIPKARKRVTLGEVMDLWWSEYGQKLRSTTINLFAEKHLRKGFGKLALADLRPGRIETFLNEKKDELAPRSINHLRSHLRRLFNIAIKKELWSGTNPIAEVEKADVPKRLPDYLRTEEVPLVLAALEPEWRPLFATAIHTGGRRGELFAFRHEDVDIKARTITFARSLDSDTTKGGHADLLPIADELVPYLERALHESKSDLVFPGATGKPQRHDTKLQKTLRRAMAKAGLVVAFSHSCRTKKCGHRERRRDANPAACPWCGKTLFAKGIPRPVLFHDLRHYADLPVMPCSAGSTEQNSLPHAA